MFKVGQCVVCVDDEKRDSDDRDQMLFPQWIVKGQVYTIRDIYADDGGVGLRLEEIINPLHPLLYDSVGRVFVNEEPDFDGIRFRPVNEARLEVFRALLNPMPTKQLQRT